ncbi:MAG: hypothetical protein AAFW75_00935 [Cyanobacteria bacterium J06636_16]
MLRNTALISAVLFSFPLNASIARGADLLGPLPYAAFDDPAVGTDISPFSALDFTYFHLEDFEDESLNTPGVTLRELAESDIPDISIAFSDSVDGDDGIIDGQATGNTISLFSDFEIDSFTFDFSASELGGQLPTHAGIVWTDVGRNFGGTPRPDYLVENTIFEAFGPLGESLGSIGPLSLGDTSISRTTLEDRFLGVVNPDGISSIQLSMPGLTNWEADHLQYGSLALAPEPEPTPEPMKVPEPSSVAMFCVLAAGWASKQLLGKVWR